MILQDFCKRVPEELGGPELAIRLLARFNGTRKEPPERVSCDRLRAALENERLIQILIVLVQKN